MNRDYFFEHLDALLMASRDRGDMLALLVVKVRQMREINLSYGYSFGDAVIERVALLIGDISRQDDELISIDNNELIMILPGIRSQGQARLAANRIINEFKEPVAIDDELINININIGVAVASDHGLCANELLSAADKALGDSMDAYGQYGSSSGLDVESKPTSMVLEQGLRKAIHNDELEVYCQPKIELQSGAVVGVEVLSRWNSSVHGSVSPDVFIAVAEKTGLIHGQTKWLINNSLRQCAALGGGAENKLSLALNLSPSLLVSNDMAYVISSALEVWGVDPACLTLEITENAIMENPEQCLKVLSNIHSTGVRLSIDDFGTGYSSLAYLKKLPVDELKIDQSFVINMERSTDDVKIVRSIVELAHNFGLTVVAEGVESQRAMDMLSDLGCDYAQGFFIAKPMPMGDTQAWLANYDKQRLTG